MCKIAGCGDGYKNGNETDVDCGGSCTACPYTKACLVNSDCLGGDCSGGVCAATCTDTIKNGNESDVDCGGSCPKGADMQYTPRAIFALINADEREKVLTSNTMWCCVS